MEYHSVTSKYTDSNDDAPENFVLLRASLGSRGRVADRRKKVSLSFVSIKYAAVMRGALC